MFSSSPHSFGTGQMQAATDASGNTAQVSTGGFDGQTASSGVTDLSGQQTQTIQDSHGNVILEIQTLKDVNQQITGYIVTVHDYGYAGDSNLENLIQYGVSDANALIAITDYNPIQLPATASGADLQNARGTIAHIRTFYTFNPEHYQDQVAGEYLRNVFDPDLRQLQSDTVIAADGVTQRTTSFADYKFGKPQVVTDADGNVTYYKYDEQGLLEWTADALGEGTEYQYLPAISGAGAGDAGFNNPGNLLLATYQVVVVNPACAFDNDPSTNESITQVSATPLQSNTYYDNSAPQGSRWKLRSTTEAAGLPTFFAYDASGNQVISAKLVVPTGRMTPMVINGDDAQWLVNRTVYDTDDRAIQSTQGLYDDSNFHAPNPAADDLIFSWHLQVNTNGSSQVVIDEAVHTAERVLSSTSYNASGQVDHTTDEYGGVTTNTYDLRGQLIRTTYPDGTEVRSVYDMMGRVIWQTDRFMPANSTLSSTANVALVTHTIYNQQGQVSSTQRYKNVAITIVADTSTTVSGILKAVAPTGLSSSSSQYLSATETYYDDKGRVIETDDANGLRAGTIYYDNGQVRYTGPLSSTAPHGGHSSTIAGVTTLAFTTSDFVANSYITYIYHQLDTSTGHPYSGLYYDEVIDANDHSTKSYNDAFGTRSFTVFNDGTYTKTLTGLLGISGHDVSSQYQVPTSLISSDELSRFNIVKAVVKIDQAGTATEYLYDLAGRLIAVVEPDPDGSGDQIQSRWLYRYDINGNQVNTYDPRANIEAVDNGNAYRQRTQYDAYGNMIDRLSHDAGSMEESWTYDSHNRTSQYNSPTAVVTYSYDDSTAHGGRLLEEDRYLYPSQIITSHYTPSETTTYGYDDLGRQINVEDQTFDSNHTQLTDRISRYAYDPISGNQAIDSTPEGTVHHVYDAGIGHLSSTWTGPAVTSSVDAQAQSISDAITRTDYTYDTFGRLATATLVRRYSVTITTENVTRYSYDNLGNLYTTEEGLSSSDGANMGTSSASDKLFSRTTYTYNNLNELTDETVKKVDITSGSEVLTPIAEYIYGYDSTGQRNTETDKDYNTDGSLFSTTTIAYTYDKLDRLTKEDHRDDASADETYINVYTLDALGNRLTETHDAGADDTIDTTTISHYFNNSDELTFTASYSGTTTTGTPVDETDYGYNADGSTNSIATYHNGSFVEQITYNTNDLRGRITSETDQTTSGLTHYYFTYDADGRRIQQITKDDSGNITQVQQKLIDDVNPTGYNQILEVRAASSQSALATTAPDTYVLGLSVTGQWLATATTIGYYVTDGHSSVRGFVSGNGTVDSSHWMDYDAFGVGLNFDVSAALSHIQFNGQWWDAAEQTLDIRNRPYRPSIGRLLGSDNGFAIQLDNPITFNNFIFANANPVSFIDPSGHESLTEISVVTGIAAAVILLTSANIAWAPGPNYPRGQEPDQMALAFDVSLVVGPVLAKAGKILTPLLTKAARWGTNIIASPTANGEMVAFGRTLSRYNILGEGPLPADLAGTFAAGEYAVIQTAEPVTLFRVWGGNAREFGAFWSFEAPAGSLQAKIDSAILPQWGNDATQWTSIKVPSGTRIFVGQTGSQGSTWVGGASQVLIDGGPQQAWKISGGNLK